MEHTSQVQDRHFFYITATSDLNYMYPVKPVACRMLNVAILNFDCCDSVKRPYLLKYLVYVLLMHFVKSCICQRQRQTSD